MNASNLLAIIFAEVSDSDFATLILSKCGRATARRAVTLSPLAILRNAKCAQTMAQSFAQTPISFSYIWLMKKLSLIVLLFLILTTSVNVFSQKYFKEAEKKFSSKEYYAAIDLYKASYKKADSKLKPEILWKIAECYRLISQIKDAKIFYKKAIDSHCEQSELAKFYLADTTLIDSTNIRQKMLKKNKRDDVDK